MGEEEEKNAYYHQIEESVNNNCSDIHQSDFSSSSFFLCRIAIFLYAFISILIFRYFPSSKILNKSETIFAQWSDWFKFYLFVNIIGCMLGLIGVYVNRAKLVLICWIFLSVSLFLTAFLLIWYVFNKNDGVHFEATNRCNQWMKDENFSKTYTLNQCIDNMQHQLLWIVIGLFIIYCIAALFGIYVIRTHERYIKHYLLHHPKKKSLSVSNLSNLSSEYYEDIQLEEESVSMIKHIESKKDK